MTVEQMLGCILIILAFIACFCVIMFILTWGDTTPSMHVDDTFDGYIKEEDIQAVEVKPVIVEEDHKCNYGKCKCDVSCKNRHIKVEMPKEHTEYITKQATIIKERYTKKYDNIPDEIKTIIPNSSITQSNSPMVHDDTVMVAMYAMAVASNKDDDNANKDDDTVKHDSFKIDKHMEYTHEEVSAPAKHIEDTTPNHSSTWEPYDSGTSHSSYDSYGSHSTLDAYNSTFD